MAKFYYTDQDFCETTQGWDCDASQYNQFDRQLTEGWDRALAEGYFRYRLDIEDTKIIGDKNYVAQLNVKRATERRKPDEIMTVNQPFNPSAFNFTKINSGEIIFELVKGANPGVGQSECNGTVINGCVDANIIQDTCCKHKVRNLVMINVSPLEYGHILLVPDIDAYQPQVLTLHAIRLSIETMLLSRHRGFRLGFNSLCALASVNHQHLHAYYLERELFVETCPVDHISGVFYELSCMPTKGFAFQLHGTTIDKLSKLLYRMTEHFCTNEIAHNIYMTRGTVFGEPRDSPKRTLRIYLWPRRKVTGVKDEAAFNVALVELAGHIPVKIRELFHGLDQESVEATIREAALDEGEYRRIRDRCVAICEEENSTV